MKVCNKNKFPLMVVFAILISMFLSSQKVCQGVSISSQKRKSKWQFKNVSIFTFKTRKNF